ncbi:hypothetical protein SAY87_021329 [Trapa incisa]|uniref:S-protein homolog n=1 Tax=Trapa incisa TaxID=236973 RepID=A0AAN7JRY4_9MYRT|nr:hypothetical protein SAY87_021329 [Trapa incisa]
MEVPVRISRCKNASFISLGLVQNICSPGAKIPQALENIAKKENVFRRMVSAFSSFHLVISTVVVILLSILVSGASKAVAGGQLGDTVVIKINNFPDAPLGIRCFSDRGADEGSRSVAPAAAYEFSFQSSDRVPARVYKCRFQWRSNVHDYIVYYQPRETCVECSWFVTAEGPCHGEVFSGDVKCHKWSETLMDGASQ